MKNRVRDVILRRSALIIMLLLVLGAVSLLRIVSTHKDVADVAEIDLPLIEILTQIETNQLEQSINFERAVRYANETPLNIFTNQNFATADSTFRYLAKIVDEDLLRSERLVSEAFETTKQQVQKSNLRILLLHVKKLESDHTSYEEHAIRVLDLLETGNMVEALILTDKVEQEEDQFNKQVEGVLFRHENFTESLMKYVEKEEVLSMQWVVAFTLLFVIFSLVAVYTFSYKIWRPLEDIRTGAERLGAGDFGKRVKLRSNSITEDIVEAFNSMADKLQNAQKDIDKFISFSYKSSHDLKAPIENIRSLLAMLDKEKVGGSNYDTILNNAKRSAHKLETTVTGLSEFNQIREQLGTKRESLNFEAVLKEVVGKLIGEIKETNVSIRKDFSACPQVFYPVPHLRSILFHLLSNAIKYRDPDKKAMIEIRTRVTNGKIILMIRDNGLGFDSIKHSEEILAPFVRLHSHTEGTGLGLHILKTIIDFHKGSIRIDSEPKKGAKFVLRLN